MSDEGEQTDPRDAELTAANFDRLEAELDYAHGCGASDWLNIVGRRVIRSARRAVERTGEGRGDADGALSEERIMEAVTLRREGASLTVAEATGVSGYELGWRDGYRTARSPTPPSAEGLREALAFYLCQMTEGAMAVAIHANNRGRWGQMLERADTFLRDWPALAAQSTAGTGEAADVGAGGPAAWRVRVMNGWLVCDTEEDARQLSEDSSGGEVQPLYALSTPAPTPALTGAGEVTAEGIQWLVDHRCPEYDIEEEGQSKWEYPEHEAHNAMLDRLIAAARAAAGGTGDGA